MVASVLLGALRAGGRLRKRPPGSGPGERNALRRNVRLMLGIPLLAVLAQSSVAPKSACSPGRVAVAKNRLVDEERLARRAWDLVRRQTGELAGDEARLAFGVSAGDYAA